jgi:hypothetical protein
MRALRALLAAFIVASTAYAAQAPASHPPATLELGVQVGYVPLYGGDATVGSLHTWLLSARVARSLPVVGRHTMLELSYAAAAKDRNPYNFAPAVRILSVGLRRVSWPDEGRPVRLFALAGLGRFWVDGDETTCTFECGPSFKDGAFTTAFGGIGLFLRLSRWGALRGDVRLWVPLDEDATAGSSNDPRAELAFGVAARL